MSYSSHHVPYQSGVYPFLGMPKLWTDTIEEHRNAVQTEIMDTTAALVATHGLRGVTMSQIAEDVGIGRATLYKYYPDVDTILHAWHQRQIHNHLEQLQTLAVAPGSGLNRLKAVVAKYALLQFDHRDHELASLLHAVPQINHSHDALGILIEGLIAAAIEEGTVRNDTPARELSAYTIASIGAVQQLSSKAAVNRLVSVTIDGLSDIDPSR